MQPMSALSRWEFRVWLPPEVDINPIADWAELDGEERTDLYVLPPRSLTVLPKIRDGKAIEIKDQVEREPPFERWSVALSATFPLNEAALSSASLKLVTQKSPFSARDGDSAESFLAAIRTRAPDTLLRTVTKDRRRYERGELMGEWTKVKVAETGTQAVTLALESVRLDLLKQAVAEAGVADRPNLDYGTWLRSI